MNEQLSLFGNVYISQLLLSLNNIHKYSYHCYSDIEEPEYCVYRYKDGDILLCVYKKSLSDTITKERIISKSVYLKLQYNGMYLIAHFDRTVLAGLIDFRCYDILLDCFIKRTELIDDLGL
ncbi:MAG: hypothetical protein SOY02_06625 [Candidatus Onthovivens sp.]|nr:hypothetical protein [Candidatus Onthovivens sp.]